MAVFLISESEFEERMGRRALLDETARKNLDAEMLDAAEAGFRRELARLLAAGADPNACTADGVPALAVANQAGCVLTLLEGRANPLLKGPLGLPFIYQLRGGNTQCAQILEKNMPYHVVRQVRAAAFEAITHAPPERMDRITDWVRWKYAKGYRAGIA